MALPPRRGLQLIQAAAIAANVFNPADASAGFFIFTNRSF
jgi:hypothetical protein